MMSLISDSVFSPKEKLEAFSRTDINKISMQILFSLYPAVTGPHSMIAQIFSLTKCSKKIQCTNSKFKLEMRAARNNNQIYKKHKQCRGRKLSCKKKSII